MLLDPATASWFLAASALVGAVTWWIVRKRQQSLWLPIIRVLDFEPKRLPKLRWEWPPWAAFLSFVVLASLLTLLSLRPFLWVQEEPSHNRMRLHYMVDLSPSVSAHKSIDELRALLTELWQTGREDFFQSFSSSIDAEMVEPEDLESLKLWLDKLDYHRPGLTIGKWVQAMLPELRSMDRLVIVSDRDLHSWEGFQWKVLADSLDIRHFDLSRPQANQNHFIAELDDVGPRDRDLRQWDVELARVHADGPSEGIALVADRGKVQAQSPYRFAADEQRIQVRLEWSEERWSQSLQQQRRLLDFSIEPKVADRLGMDDKVKHYDRRQGQRVMVLSSASGERPLEDPTYHLRTGLEVMGLQSRYLDDLRQPGPEPTDFQIIVGGTLGAEHFCPKSFAQHRWQAAAQGSTLAPKELWLVPDDGLQNFGNLCHCLHILLKNKQGDLNQPGFCKDIEGRASWAELLRSVGGKQLGGTVGQEGEALAWSFKDSAGIFELLVFTIPLSPSPATGISYGRLPILLRSLLEVRALLPSSETTQADQWPQINDWVATGWGLEDKAKKEKLRQCNIPRAESSLRSLDAELLPPRFDGTSSELLRRAEFAPKDRDPVPIIAWLSFLIVTFLLVELALGLWERWRKRGHSKKTYAQALAWMVIWGLSERPAVANIEIIHSPGSQQLSRYQQVALDVEARTSIELSPQPRQLRSLKSEALTEAWIWVDRLATLQDGQGQMKAEIAAWLRRGGFLLVEESASEEVLNKLVAQHFHRGRNRAEWSPIPPDHELMRSFYLIDALPSCGQTSWSGLHFDGRLAMVVIPFSLLNVLKDQGKSPGCAPQLNREQALRLFINIMMVALATDYKKDQIHLPEILKRLR